MLYSILIYGSEEKVAEWTRQEMDEAMGRHAALRADLRAQGRMGPVLRLAPLTDGPFAETKEQLMGIYVLDCDGVAEAQAAAARLDFASARFEIRPLEVFHPGMLPPRMPPGEE